MFKNVRLITFDLDDALWPTKPVIMAAEQRVYDWLGQNAPGITDSLSIHAMRGRADLCLFNLYPLQVYL
ncbi:hypothetical protein [Thiolapillus sp.]